MEDLHTNNTTTSTELYDPIDISIIEDYSLDDYFSCPETRNLLLDDWDDEFDCYIRKPIIDLFHIETTLLKQCFSNTMYKAVDEHAEDLVDIIKYHIKKEYSTDIFTENPDLAEPLIKMKKQLSNNKNELTKEDILLKIHSLLHS